MDRRTILTLGVIILIIAGAFGFLIFNSSAREAMQRTTTPSTVPATKPQQTSQAQQPASTARPGKYIDYSESALANATGTRLIFFHAPWCPQCRSLEADIQQQGVPENVTILKADYDTSQELRRKYGVTIQTTVVRVDNQGNLVKKYVAYDQPTLEAVTKNLL